MNDRARNRVAPVRLNLLVPITLGTLAAACVVVFAATLGTMPHAGTGVIISLSLAGALLLFSVAWAVFHILLVRPVQTLTRETENLTLTQQNRALLMPPRHALERLPRAVEELARKLALARAETGEAIAAGVAGERLEALVSFSKAAA